MMDYKGLDHYEVKKMELQVYQTVISILFMGT